MILFVCRKSIPNWYRNDARKSEFLCYEGRRASKHPEIHWSGGWQCPWVLLLPSCTGWISLMGYLYDDDFIFLTVGRFMVLEYCENGPLKEYLKSKRHKVNDEMHEKLYRFACGICKGMNYLASHGVLPPFISTLYCKTPSTLIK